MAKNKIVQFENGTAIIYANGTVDIRLVDDINHLTLTGRMTVEEVTQMSEHVHNATVPGLVVMEAKRGKHGHNN